jgi:uncharacterized protein YjaG (DUF416 family)
MVLQFDEKVVLRELETLPPVRRSVFAVTCAERLRPRYLEYCRKTGKGCPDMLETVLDSVWKSVLSSNNLTQQEFKELLRLCESLYPEEEEPWIPERDFAEDAVVASMYAIRCKTSGDPQAAAWAAKRVNETVFLFLDDFYNLDSNDEKAFAWVLNHPLAQAELQRQQRDLAELKASAVELEEFRIRARLESALLFDEQSAQQYLKLSSNI